MITRKGYYVWSRTKDDESESEEVGKILEIKKTGNKKPAVEKHVNKTVN
jgi:hypothetical protein